MLTDIATTAVLAANILMPTNAHSTTDTVSFIAGTTNQHAIQRSISKSDNLDRGSFLSEVSPTETAFSSLRKELVSYLSLEENWDGYDGQAPAKGAVIAAIDFSAQLMNDGLKLPKPMLSGDGEVGLYIDDGNVFVDIGFENATHFSYYVERSDGSSFGEDDVEIASGYPAALRKVLQKPLSEVTRSAA